MALLLSTAADVYQTSTQIVMAISLVAIWSCYYMVIASLRKLGAIVIEVHEFWETSKVISEASL